MQPKHVAASELVIHISWK